MKETVRRYKYRIYPSPEQENYLSRVFGSCRFVYNEFLKINQDMRKDGNFPRLSRNEMQTHLTIWKEILPWMNEIPSQALQVATHDLDVAYKNHFQKINNAGLPTLKKLSSRQSFSLPQPKLKNVSGQMCIFLPVFKTWIPIKMHREIPKNAKTGSATITKLPCGKYFVSIVVKFLDAKTIESKSSEMIGIDLNIKEFVLSNGTRVATPQRMKTVEKRIRRLQKSMQRQRDKNKHTVVCKFTGNEITKISNNYEKNRVKLAKLHDDMKNMKEDFFRKLAIEIFRESQSVSMETLKVKNMMKNRRLARSIAFQSWGRFVEIMKEYALQYDKDLHFISQWFPSSKMCSSPGCGFVNENLSLKDRNWVCEACGSHHDRDLNAAINIKNEGGSYPRHKPAEKKGSVKRPRRQTTHASVTQESSRFEGAA